MHHSRQRFTLTSLCIAPLFAIILLLPASPTLTADEPPPVEFILEWGTPGDQPGQFHSPVQIAINHRDEVFVADLNNARIQKFDTQGRHLGGFDLPLDNPVRKQSLIGGMTVDDGGKLYCTFMMQHKVIVYRDDGMPLREWGKQGSEPGQFQQPGGILLLPDGNLLIADQCNHRIQKFNSQGEFLTQWGEHGSKPGQFGGLEKPGSRFDGPHYIARDSLGRIYTTEGYLGRIQQFDPDGKPLRAWGNKSDDPGGFGSYELGGITAGPVGVFVAPDDRIYVTSLSDRIHVFSTTGQFLYRFGITGSEPGDFVKPHGMAVDSQGFFYVADAGNQRIQKFKLTSPQ